MNAIKYYREQKNLSQQEVANELSISQQAIARWENGETLPRAEKLPQLAVILGCKIDDLFKEMDKERG